MVMLFTSIRSIVEFEGKMVDFDVFLPVFHEFKVYFAL